MALFFINNFNSFGMLKSKNEAGNLLPMEYTFNGTQIRTIVLDAIPYFVAKDVCSILDIANHKDAVSRLDEDESRGSVMPTPSGRQRMTLVNESGLYHLIFQSRKPEAKVFRRWVTSEVLPELRKTGAYSVLPDVACQVVNDRRMYPFHEMAIKLGYKSVGSLYDKRNRYPGQFVKIGRLLFASEEICRFLAVSRRVFRMRQTMTELQPVLGAAPENTLFGYGKA